MKRADRILREQVMGELGDFVADELEGPHTGSGPTVSARISPLALDHLTRIAEEAGLCSSQIIRQGVAQWLRAYHKERREALERAGDRTGDLAEDLARQAGELFGQLPVGEILDDEPLKFRTGPEGEIVIDVDRTGQEYQLFKGHAVRLAATGEGVAELTFFRSGHVVEKRPVRIPVPAGVARG